MNAVLIAHCLEIAFTFYTLFAVATGYMIGRSTR